MTDIPPLRRFHRLIYRRPWMLCLLSLLLGCCIGRWSSRATIKQDRDQAAGSIARFGHRLVNYQDNDDLVQRLLTQAFGAAAHDTRITPFYVTTIPHAHDRGQSNVDRDSLSLTTWLTIDRLHRLEALSNNHAGKYAAGIFTVRFGFSRSLAL
jgi:hypothetical protein